MELDRPHHRTATPSTSSTTSNELFICFTSRLSSSSSMKLAKSILSPGRARDPPSSLSTSLSRRLRTNGSLKGGQASPMFPTGGKKRSGCAFENPEPSSPKVTCIGQVRVKTKKKVKQTRSLSRRASGEVSFRKVEQQLSHDEMKKNSEESVCGRMQQRGNLSSHHFQQQECFPQRNQRWVHLPVSICEALRAFGAEFSCLFPCRSSSSCFSTNERDKEEKANREAENNGQSNSCGAVFARWFVALQDCEGGKGREIELVVGGGDEESTEVRERISMRSSRRRHVFEDIEFKEETIQVKKGEEEEGDHEEEKARVSICIPPKNALLLMRCRSDPMKMASLANRFWESPPPKDEDQNEEEEENAEENKVLEEELAQDQDEEERDEVVEQFVSSESNGEAENQEKDANLANEVQEFVPEEQAEKLDSSEELDDCEKMQALVANEEAESDLHSYEMVENKEEDLIQEQQVEQEEEEEIIQTENSLSSAENSDIQDSEESETEKKVLLESSSVDVEVALEEENQEKTEKSALDEEEIQEPSLEQNEEKQTTTLFISDLEDSENAYEEEKIDQIEEEENGQESSKELQEENEVKKGMTESSNVLPDCLLLMMCEPKLSMEVSKETWVCSTDFLRWLPERPVKKKVNVDVNLSDEPKKDKVSTDSCNYPPFPPPPLASGPLPPPPPEEEIMTQQQKQEAMLPPGSSCSLPAAAAAASMAAMIEQKLVNAVAYEPFVLTRCKSEPMRTAAAKLMPEACFWKNRKLEPHRNANFGVGAAGVGF